ncbi:MAG: undecaprenyl-phosphate glucose phosphotransferase [Alphaproteobacteria bacterium]
MLSRASDSVSSPAVVLDVLRLVDAVVVIVAAVAAYLLRHGHLEAPFSYVVVTAIGVVLMANALHAAKLYTFDVLMNLPGQFYKLSAVLPAVLMMLLALGYFTKTSEEFSRAWIALWFAFSFAGLIVVRGVLLAHLRGRQRQGRLTRNVVIVGAGELGQRLVHHLAESGEPGIKLLGLFDDRHTRIPMQIEGYEVLGSVDDLVGFMHDHRVDDLVIALPWNNEPRLIECMNRLKTVPVNVHLCPDSIGFHLYNRGVSHVGGVPLFSISEPPLSGWSQLLKTAEDRILAALILVLILPLLAVIAVLVKLDSPGPVLFRQKRYGFNSEVITVCKFRTMVDDPSYADGAWQATRNDARVTRVGAFLRRHSLDELPQLVNVLKGEMSIVGPRPHAVVHNEQYARLIDGYLGRHKVKPGITGWAQVNGLRGETDTLEKMKARVQHDLYYVDHWSLLFDLRILLLTLVLGFRSENAY